MYKRQIPSNKARDIYEQIKEQGSVRRGWLGVQLHSVPPAILEQYNLSRGVLLYAVLDQSPAEKAGLKRGDIVLQWNGNQVDTPGDFSKQVSATTPGSAVSVDIFRNGENLTVPVTVGQKPLGN